MFEIVLAPENLVKLVNMLLGAPENRGAEAVNLYISHFVYYLE
jgi:hypothetical protein